MFSKMPIRPPTRFNDETTTGTHEFFFVTSGHPSTDRLTLLSFKQKALLEEHRADVIIIEKNLTNLKYRLTITFQALNFFIPFRAKPFINKKPDKKKKVSTDISKLDNIVSPLASKSCKKKKQM